MLTFESLPVELVADILSELDLESLIKASYLSRTFRDIVSDAALNPWRRPILRNLTSNQPETALNHLSVRSTVPRHNWIEILSLASPSFILYSATLPNLKQSEWEECFRRRFLPGWTRWRKDSSWRETFIRLLFLVSHRSITPCVVEEAWIKYVVLNRNGSANELEAASRNFSPLLIFNELKLQNDLAHLDTRIRLVVELRDVRIIAFGVLHRPRSTLTINANAKLFLHPPGVEEDDTLRQSSSNGAVSDHGVYPIGETSSGYPQMFPVSPDTYTRLTEPLPAPSHRNYPLYTPGGGDKRWIGSGDMEEDGLQWVGGMMLIAQLLGPKTHESGALPSLQDLDLIVGPGRQQHTSFSFADLLAIAPWMEERITKMIDGPGLGN